VAHCTPTASFATKLKYSSTAKTANIAYPVQVIADYERYFHGVAGIIARCHRAQGVLLNMKEIERKILGLRDMRFKEDTKDAMMFEI
jgi:hypothetical protein